MLIHVDGPSRWVIRRLAPRTASRSQCADVDHRNREFFSGLPDGLTDVGIAIGRQLATAPDSAIGPAKRENLVCQCLGATDDLRIISAKGWRSGAIVS